jgi:hypothetical protein
MHRKGAVSTLTGPVVIPGSRGSLTYVVMPSTNADEAACSLSHGAGRKWMRSLCKGRISGKYDKNTIRETRLGSKTVCHDTDLLYEEAPEAYKNIESIMDVLVGHGLCSIIATLRPLITFKGNGGQHVNKTESGVRAVYRPTGQTAISTDERSQHMNKKLAVKRLRGIVMADNASETASAKARNRLEHTRIERGNPVRVYEGIEFRLVRRETR